MLMQKESDITNDLNHQLDKAKKNKEKTIAKLAADNEDLVNTNKILADDKEYLASLTKMCADKKTTYEQRVEVRTDELSALQAAIDIVKGQVSEKTSSSTIRFVQKAVRARMVDAAATSPTAMEAIEAEAEAAAQRQAAKASLRHAVLHMSSSQDTVLCGTCIRSWRDVVVLAQHELSKQEVLDKEFLLKEQAEAEAAAQRQAAKASLRHAVLHMSSLFDSALASKCMRSWSEAVVLATRYPWKEKHERSKQRERALEQELSGAKDT